MDRDLIICVKPHGVPSQPDPSGSEDMTAMLARALAERGERNEIFVVHRLDRATGGVMLYARNKRACAHLSQLISEKDSFSKEYLAVVSGAPEESEGTYRDILYRDPMQKKAFVVKSERKGAKLAELDHKLISTREYEGRTLSLLSVRLRTGRFHQIRAQLSSRGMPIFGDGKYGSREKAPQIALWSRRIAFNYGGKQYDVSSEPDATATPWCLFN